MSTTIAVLEAEKKRLLQDLFAVETAISIVNDTTLDILTSFRESTEGNLVVAEESLSPQPAEPPAQTTKKRGRLKGSTVRTPATGRLSRIHLLDYISSHPSCSRKTVISSVLDGVPEGSAEEKRRKACAQTILTLSIKDDLVRVDTRGGLRVTAAGKSFLSRGV
jgi:hypothetical protein